MNTQNLKDTFNQLLADSLDPIIWKFSVMSLLVAVLSVSVLGHLILNESLGYLFNLGFVSELIPESISPHMGILTSILAFLLFAIAMPLLSMTILPFMVFFQILFFEPFAKQFQTHNFPESKPHSSKITTNILIFAKWTAVKGLLFLLLSPLFHIPFLGWFFHLFLMALWITMIYYEIVSRRYGTNTGFWTELRFRIGGLSRIAILGMSSAYFVIWILAFLSVLLPPLKPLLLTLMAAFVVTSNYIMAGGFLRSAHVFSADYVVHHKLKVVGEKEGNI